MAKFQGKDAFQDQNLIVTVPNVHGLTYTKGHKGDAKYVNGAFIDAQVDQSLRSVSKIQKGDVKGVQRNPHLTNERRKYVNKEGKTAYATVHRQWYAKSQIEAIKKAAMSVKPAKAVQAKDGVAYGINASLLENSHHQIIVNTKNLKPTKNPKFGKDTLKNQAAVTAAANKVYEDRYQASKQAAAPQASAQATAPAAPAPAQKQASDNQPQGLDTGVF